MKVIFDHLLKQLDRIFKTSLHIMLAQYYIQNQIEAGCDEAGRGSLAGPVFAAAVILPQGYSNDLLNDSKKLSQKQRNLLRHNIENDALAFAIASVDNSEIDKINILNASFHAMNLAVKKLTTTPDMLLIDGNRFKNETDIPFHCIVKGDAKYQSIAAASILAKTYRDEFMCQQHLIYPDYGWNANKGYPTTAHYDAIERCGITPLHRKSFTLYRQKSLFETENGEQGGRDVPGPTRKRTENGKRKAENGKRKTENGTD